MKFFQSFLVKSIEDALHQISKTNKYTVLPVCSLMEYWQLQRLVELDLKSNLESQFQSLNLSYIMIVFNHHLI